MQPGHITLEFFFPRTTASGAPTINETETLVTFVCKGRGFKVKVKFKPQEMRCPDGVLP
jgi:hypothetical protein